MAVLTLWLPGRRRPDNNMHGDDCVSLDFAHGRPKICSHEITSFASEKADIKLADIRHQTPSFQAFLGKERRMHLCRRHTKDWHALFHCTVIRC